MFVCKQDKNQITSLLDNCAFLDYHAASSGNFVPKFRDILSVPSSEFKNLGIIQKSSSSQLLRGGSLISHTSLLYDIFWKLSPRTEPRALAGYKGNYENR